MIIMFQLTPMRSTCVQLASVPRMNAEAFSKLFNESVQDVLLVMYLANMTRTQLILADKLSIGTYGY